MTIGVRIELELKRGCLVRFCGVAHAVKSKRVARLMQRGARPVWSARARGPGYRVMHLVDAGIPSCDSFIVERLDEFEGAVRDMAVEYLKRLEAVCIARTRKH